MRRVPPRLRIRHITAPTAKSPSSTDVITIRLRIVAPSAAELVVTVVSRPYIDASRTPSPPGAKTTSTATIAPIAAVPPRNGIDESGADPPTARIRK